MNARKLREIGVPEDCVSDAIQAVQAIAKRNRSIPKEGRIKPEVLLAEVLAAPQDYLNDELVGGFARAVKDDAEFIRPAGCDFEIFGEHLIEPGAVNQMHEACSTLPNAVAAALMPDAHFGYSIPIGGVLALDNAVSPYAVGVDIACRMKLSVFPIAASQLEKRRETFRDALLNGTVFGVGQSSDRPDHDVMDKDWSVTRVTRENKDRAWSQLGTSGSGNHFVEFGVLTLNEPDAELSLEAGTYVSVLSHSGSRGPGAAVCDTYSRAARLQLPRKYADVGQLAWLDMNTQEGQEYWAAMNLMGDYAAANHSVIHRRLAKLIGERPLVSVENHHNFCWLEEIGGKKLYVHRKGATPAGKGVLGVIPGSMADPAYVVRGKGNPKSLNSASHGAGRAMSRRQAKEKFNWRATQKNLLARGVEVLSAGADEVPGVYKNIDVVMEAQRDLVDVVARFDPKIVRMCGDGSKAED